MVYILGLNYYQTEWAWDVVARCAREEVSIRKKRVNSCGNGRHEERVVKEMERLGSCGELARWWSNL